MTNDYTSKLLNEFDQMFMEMVGDYNAEILDFPAPTPKPVSASAPVFTPAPAPVIKPAPAAAVTTSNEKLRQIAQVVDRISAERFNPSAQIDILLADLIDSVLQILSGNSTGDDFFKLLNEERSVKLDVALADFDFYNDNPYKTKAEKYLAKIEARKNRM